ncbi:MAG: hypothetical protein KJ077_08055 [Anaerolineae bacterium]|nr:hypothetical protein [Anaerolineae bacterium]
MSVVACRIREDGYEIAADSITVRGYTQTKGENTSLSKLFETKDMVVGTVGTAEEGSLFRLFCATRKPAAASEYAMLEFFSEFSEWKEKKTSNSSIENSYIIGFGDKCFAVEQWLVEEILTFQAIGAGMDFALAALHLGHSVRVAVETAIELSVYCESPVIAVSKERTVSSDDHR